MTAAEKLLLVLGDLNSTQRGLLLECKATAEKSGVLLRKEGFCSHWAEGWL